MRHWQVKFYAYNTCCLVAESESLDGTHVLSLVLDFMKQYPDYVLDRIESVYGEPHPSPAFNNPVLRQFTEKNLLCMLMIENAHGLMSKPHPSEKDLDTARELISKAEAMGIEARRLDIVKAQTSLDFAQSDFDCDKYR